MRRLIVAACALLCTLCVTSAQAARAKPFSCDSADIIRPCGSFQLDQPGHSSPAQRTRHDRGAAAAIGLAARILSHPPGCPRRAFCGCGASVEVFGCPVRSLFLAANWLRFPRAAPAPGMVAARRGHVFVLRQHISGKTWLAYDANSGGRRTRLHARSIAGFSIVNPHGSG
ncbi:hypothetical protein [Tardiphaga sp.]|jgi:hypothetical protein|uniref:hypothetical protein n=1 Tax=Tardiphaga sp. TaxID=1926292 RepID=UPI0037D9D02F